MRIRDCWGRPLPQNSALRVTPRFSCALRGWGGQLSVCGRSGRLMKETKLDLETRISKMLVNSFTSLYRTEEHDWTYLADIFCFLLLSESLGITKIFSLRSLVQVLLILVANCWLSISVANVNMLCVVVSKSHTSFRSCFIFLFVYI